MRKKRQRWILGFLLLIFAWTSSCGEPIPVDCATEEECTTENEGGFQTGTVAGIAAGGAAVAVLAGGAISGGGDSSDGGGSSGSGSSTTNNNGSSSNTGPILTGTLIDSAVAGVSYQNNSNLSGLTSVNGSFEYRSGDQVTFQIGGTVLGTVTGGAVITPVELAGVSNTADRRVINIARLLQSLDEDQDPSNGININSTTRSAMAGRSIVFDVPVSSFSSNESVLQIAIGKGLVASEDAINHLHGTLAQQGRPGYVATEAAIQQLVPSFVAESVSGGTGMTTQSCNFAGGTVPDGGNVIAYQSESVAAGGTCSSQTRVCNNGQLSGTYAYTSCQVEEATDCQFNGNSIANGLSITAYQSAAVPFGSTCTSQTRSCSNGTLSGSYSFSNCEQAEPLDCSFNGSTLEHGDFVRAYLSDSVAAGSSCSSQTRTCFNGVLSGTYLYSTCSIAEAASCNFNGVSIADGDTTTAYLSSSVPFGSTCTSQIRACSDGTLSGSYSFSNCEQAEPLDCSFNGSNVEHGDFVTAYLSNSVAAGNSCSSQTRTCFNGVLSGSYTNSNCSVSSVEGNVEKDIASCVERNQSRKTTNEIIQISVGSSSSCVLFKDGLVKCWGEDYGIKPVKTFQSATCIGNRGGGRGCAIVDDGTVACWNASGQITPVPNINSAIDLDISNDTSCAVLESGITQCWGGNQHGQFGAGTFTDSNNPVSAEGVTSAIQIEIGSDSAIALLKDGTTMYWGGNGKYLPAIIPNLINVIDISVSHSSNFLINLENGNILEANYWDLIHYDDTYSQFTQVQGLDHIVQVDSSHWLNCALIEDGTIKCWDGNAGLRGYFNYDPYLGNGEPDGIDSYLPVDVSNISDAIEVRVGGYNDGTRAFAHGCALQSNDEVKCWGDNGFGQLGDGTILNRGIPVNVIDL